MSSKRCDQCGMGAIPASVALCSACETLARLHERVSEILVEHTPALLDANGAFWKAEAARFLASNVALNEECRGLRAKLDELINNVAHNARLDRQAQEARLLEVERERDAAQEMLRSNHPYQRHPQGPEAVSRLAKAVLHTGWRSEVELMLRAADALEAHARVEQGRERLTDTIEKLSMEKTALELRIEEQRRGHAIEVDRLEGTIAAVVRSHDGTREYAAQYLERARKVEHDFVTAMKIAYELTPDCQTAEEAVTALSALVRKARLAAETMELRALEAEGILHREGWKL